MKKKKLIVDIDECNILCNALLGYKDAMSEQGVNTSPVMKLLVKCYETPMRKNRGDRDETQ